MTKVFLVATSSTFVYDETKEKAIESLLVKLKRRGVKEAKYCGIADVTHVKDGLRINHSNIEQFEVEDGEILRTDVIEINFVA